MAQVAGGLIAAAVLIAVLPWRGPEDVAAVPAAPITAGANGAGRDFAGPAADDAATPSWGAAPVRREAADDDWQLLWERLSDQLAADRIQSLGPLAEGIRPITASLGSVLDELLSTFPLGREPSAQEPSEDSAWLPQLAERTV